ncbi:hypothetical protein AVEN_89622-1 [Araneus ventricosus]|uniref:SCAN box domain-containing protein n=1 Tax=Araneus ventricosus TaxID=182803 RepID=A0A4Y2NGK9_ARAVE|nr:hypothetical protein AVEN_89622-1 [Araneus ventricosus]
MGEIEETMWVNHLLGLLPVKLAGQIIKLPGDKTTDYDFVMSKLLERFKLNVETLRTKFMNFERPLGTLWKELIFDLRTYLDGWLGSLEVKYFEELKDLMIADQLKKTRFPRDERNFFRL